MPIKQIMNLFKICSVTTNFFTMVSVFCHFTKTLTKPSWVFVAFSVLDFFELVGWSMKLVGGSWVVEAWKVSAKASEGQRWVGHDKNVGVEGIGMAWSH